jgi:hypothetical protein
MSIRDPRRSGLRSGQKGASFNLDAVKAKIAAARGAMAK